MSKPIKYGKSKLKWQKMKLDGVFPVIPFADLYGREVAELVDVKQMQGNYKVEFNGSNLTNGVYFYRMQAVPSTNSGQVFVETKILILLK